MLLTLMLLQQINQPKIKIFNIASRNSIKLSNIYVINSSVRSAHSNAYLYGIGKNKAIVLNDSLLGTLNRE
jgi:STE24 endopeptidase